MLLVAFELVFHFTTTYYLYLTELFQDRLLCVLDFVKNHQTLRCSEINSKFVEMTPTCVNFDSV